MLSYHIKKGSPILLELLWIRWMVVTSNIRSKQTMLMSIGYGDIFSLSLPHEIVENPG